tara:strand:+ start:126 stop:698 length:573 start_codon:yes stop_codon:yes gene_type:complete
MIVRSLKIFILFLFCQGCLFYSIRGSLPVHINSISLAPVVNESAEFEAAEILNEELNELMVSENVLDIVFPEEADSRLEIFITSVTDKPYTVTLSEDLGMEEVEEWKLTIKTSIKWYDMKRDEILFEKKMSSWGSYTPGVDIGSDGLDNDGDNLIDGADSDEIGSPRESALNISVRRLTEDIVNEITNTW